MSIKVRSGSDLSRRDSNLSTNAELLHPCILPLLVPDPAVFILTSKCGFRQWHDAQMYARIATRGHLHAYST